MEKSPRQNESNHQYRVRSHRGSYIQEVEMTKKEKDKLKPSDVDFHYDYTKRYMSIKMKKGKRKIYSENIPFGSTLWELLEKILDAGDEFVELSSENWQYAEIYRIRKVFGEYPKKNREYFFEVQKNPSYAIRWRPARTWRVITKKKVQTSHNDANVKT